MRKSVVNIVIALINLFPQLQSSLFFNLAFLGEIIETTLQRSSRGYLGSLGKHIPANISNYRK